MSVSQSAAPKPKDLRLIKERLEEKLFGPFQLVTRQDISDYLYVLQAEHKNET